jgi:hypothetical protein
LTLSANPSSTTVNVGSTITLTATATCGGTPVYQWYVGSLHGSSISWQQVQAYGTSNAYVWNTTGLATGTYYISPWVENQGGAGDAFDQSSALAFTVVPQSPCTGLAMSANPSGSTVRDGSSVSLTATANCPGSAVYQWFLGTLRGTSISWQQVQAYGAANTYVWNTAGLNSGTYYLSPWVENQGGPSNAFDESSALAFTVVPQSPCSDITMTSTPSGPSVTVGTSVSVTASATCGGTAAYQWFIGTLKNGSITWRQVQAYSPVNTYNWNTAGTTPGSYYISAWVENLGDSPSSFDASGALAYTLAPLPACTAPLITSSPSSSTESVGASVVFTGQATCGGMAEFQWFVGTVSGGSTQWQLAQAYSTSNTFTWNTAGQAPGSYYVSFWAQNQGGQPDSLDISTALLETLQ